MAVGPQDIGPDDVGFVRVLAGILLAIQFGKVPLEDDFAILVQKQGQSLFEHFVRHGPVLAQRALELVKGFVFGRQSDQIPHRIPQRFDHGFVVPKVGGGSGSAGG